MSKTRAATAAVLNPTVVRLRRNLEVEAKRRGISVSDLIREIDLPKVAVHARVDINVINELDAEAKARGMSRADVVRDRLERAKWRPAA